MPRQRTDHTRAAMSFPEEFPECLARFKEASGMTWKEVALGIGTTALTLRRWRDGTQPTSLHLLALMDLAHELNLSHLLPTGRTLQEQEQPSRTTMPRWDGWQMKLWP